MTASIFKSCLFFVFSMQSDPKQMDDFRLDELEKAALIGSEGRVHLLARKLIIEDKTGDREESCLLLIQINNNNRFCLAQFIRTPQVKSSRWKPIEWHEITCEFPTGIWKIGKKYFASRPKNAQVYDSLSDVFWTFDLRPGSNYVSCTIFEENWLKATGEKPTRFFGK